MKNEPGAPSLSAIVMPFPCRRQIGTARKVATKSLQGGWDVGLAYSRRIEGNMRKAMLRSGIDAATIERELSDFTQTVVDEIRRQVRLELDECEERA